MLYCDLEAARLGLYCKQLAWLVLCRNTMDCIVTEAGHGLYCNTVSRPRTALGRALGARLSARGAQAGTRARSRRSGTT